MTKKGQDTQNEQICLLLAFNTEDFWPTQSVVRWEYHIQVILTHFRAFKPRTVHEVNTCGTILTKLKGDQTNKWREFYSAFLQHKLSSLEQDNQNCGNC